MKRFVRSAARQDIQRQFRYYLVERDAPDAALRFLDAVEHAVKTISRDPGIGSPRSFRKTCRGFGRALYQDLKTSESTI